MGKEGPLKLCLNDSLLGRADAYVQSHGIDLVFQMLPRIQPEYLLLIIRSLLTLRIYLNSEENNMSLGEHSKLCFCKIL